MHGLFVLLRVAIFGLGFIQGLEAREIDLKVARSVVKVRGVDDGQRLLYGSGVVIDVDLVATNCHVIKNAIRIGVSSGYDFLPVSEEQADVKRDLCLLRVPQLGLPVARRALRNQLRLGDQVHFYGFPRALGLSYTLGKVSGFPEFDKNRIIETTAFFTLGGSGGGVFDGKGRLVGLATFMERGHIGGYYLIPSDWIYVAKKLPKAQVAPLKGFAFWERR